MVHTARRVRDGAGELRCPSVHHIRADLACYTQLLHCRHGDIHLNMALLQRHGKLLRQSPRLCTSNWRKSPHRLHSHGHRIMVRKLMDCAGFLTLTATLCAGRVAQRAYARELYGFVLHVVGLHRRRRCLDRGRAAAHLLWCAQDLHHA